MLSKTNNFKQISPYFTGNTSVSIFNINDLHGQNMHGVKKASDDFDEFCKQKHPDSSFKVSSGDSMIGTIDTPEGSSRIWTKFLNLIGIDVSTIGNHELELSGDHFAREVKNSNFKYLAANIDFKEGTDLKKLSDNETILKSCIIEKNGEKYGFIGLCPTNINEVVNKESKVNDEMQVYNLRSTIKAVNKEVEKLKKETNKIIVLSHLGYKLTVKKDALKTAESLAQEGYKVDIDYDPERKSAVISPDKIIAENSREVDIILGGHSHDKLTGIEQGKNLFYNLDNKPVIITQTGRDGNDTGILNAVFDEKGELIVNQCENILNVVDTSVPSSEVTALRKQYLGNPPPLAQISQSLVTPSNPRIQENKVASLVADAMRYVTGSQIALINSGNIRGTLYKGKITGIDINEIAPFPQKLYKVQLSEKEIVETLKYVASSFKNPTNPRPGLLQTSGLEYKISKDGRLLDAGLVSENNKKEKINIENPSDSKKFSAVFCDFLIKGCEGFNIPKRDPEELKKKGVNNPDLPEGYFSISKAEATIKYLGDKFNIDSNKAYAPDKDRIKVEIT